MNPELSRRLGRLANTPYYKTSLGLNEVLMEAFLKADSEAELPDNIKLVIELCDLSGEIAVRDRLDDDNDAVNRMMAELRQRGQFDRYFGPVTDSDDEE